MQTLPRHRTLRRAEMKTLLRPKTCRRAGTIGAFFYIKNGDNFLGKKNFLDTSCSFLWHRLLRRNHFIVRKLIGLFTNAKTDCCSVPQSINFHSTTTILILTPSLETIFNVYTPFAIFKGSLIVACCAPAAEACSNNRNV